MACLAMVHSGRCAAKLIVVRNGSLKALVAKDARSGERGTNYVRKDGYGLTLRMSGEEDAGVRLIG